MPQNNLNLIARLFGGVSQTYLGTDGSGALVATEGGVNTTLDITAATVIKAAPGRVAKVSVLVAGSSNGTINDCLTTGAAATANEVAIIPDTVGVYTFDWPLLVGLVVVPGTGQTISVSWY